MLNLLTSYPIGSMGLLYLPTFTIICHENQPNVGKYTSPMDPMGINKFSLN